MNRQRELEILELMRLKEQELWSMMQTLPHGGTHDELITPPVELMELRSEPSGSDEPDAFVGAPFGRI